MQSFADINGWVFDLDNTLYPASRNLFAQIDKRMTAFIGEALSVEKDEAFRLQKQFLGEYGTTLAGLMNKHGMPPGPFLDFVHDIDVSDMSTDIELAELLSKLPGRRLIYTNGSVAHAKRITGQLGIEHLFDDVFDIVASKFIPKPDPEPYDEMIKTFNIDPKRSLMVEDMAKNLRPAANLGMITVWLRHNRDWSSEDSDGEHIHHEIDDLKSWLKTIID